jgi:hypothetical protein
MAAPAIGTVKSGSGKTFRVAWDQYSHDVYVDWAGWTNIGKAYSDRGARWAARTLPNNRVAADGA